MWKAEEKKWEYVGEVVDPNAGGGASGIQASTKQYPGDSVFPAGEYDHVFDIELGDNIMRKLPFNNGDNAIEYAEKFCMRENIGRNMASQIQAWINQHSSPYATRDKGGNSNQAA